MAALLAIDVGMAAQFFIRGRQPPGRQRRGLNLLPDISLRGRRRRILNVRQGLIKVGILAAANQRRLPFGQILAALLCDLCDLRLNVSRPQSLNQAALRFDLLEQAPGRLGQLVGQFFDVPGAAGRVDQVDELDFFLQNQLEIAGDAARKFSGFAQGGIKGRDLQAVDSADGAGHGFGGDAQHIDIGIMAGLAAAADAGVQFDFLRRRAAAKSGRDLRPHHLDGAEFGDFHEEVLADPHEKSNFASDKFHIQAALPHFPQIDKGRRHSQGGFLDGIGAGLVINIGRCGDGVQTGRLPTGQFNKGGHLIESIRCDAARLRQRSQGIIAQTAMNLLERIVF